MLLRLLGSSVPSLWPAVSSWGQVTLGVLSGAGSLALGSWQSFPGGLGSPGLFALQQAGFGCSWAVNIASPLLFSCHQ